MVQTFFFFSPLWGTGVFLQAVFICPTQQMVQLSRGCKHETYPPYVCVTGQPLTDLKSHLERQTLFHQSHPLFLKSFVCVFKESAKCSFLVNKQILLVACLCWRISTYHALPLPTVNQQNSMNLQECICVLVCVCMIQTKWGHTRFRL